MTGIANYSKPSTYNRAIDIILNSRHKLQKLYKKNYASETVNRTDDNVLYLDLLPGNQIYTNHKYTYS